MDAKTTQYAMNTFISDYNLTKNAANLDGKRLFKQLLEGKQILNILVNGDKIKKKGWKNHPAVLQWKNYEIGLFWYLRRIWQECQNRGIALDSQLFNECQKLILSIKKGGAYIDCDETNKKVAKFILPKWWGRADILISHRSRLKCKGLVDATCTAIKSQLKIKSIDSWLKQNFKKTKNQLRYEDLKFIRVMAHANGVSFRGIKNHYDIPEWSEIPFDLDYIWPVE